MNKQLNQSYIKSSNLIFAVGGIMVANFLLLPTQFRIPINIIFFMVGFVITIGIGVLVRKGFNWTKYLMLIITLFGLNTIAMISYTFNPRSLSGLINITMQILQIWAVILLFTIRKDVTIEK